MNIFVVLLIGLVAGVLAKALMPGRDGGGLLATVGLGLAGAVVAHYLSLLLGWSTEIGLIAATIGALVVLGLFRMFLAFRPAKDGQAP